MNNKINLTEDEAFNFSIVIAVYNSQDYLNECVDSIINQTLDFKQNTQIILVDDGSIDNSKEICLEYQEKYPNNILFLSKEHEGVASARNLGLEYARGKYVNFLDSDDSLSINALEEVYEFFEQNYDKTDVVSIPMFYFERENGPHDLNYKFNRTRIIDLNKEADNPQLSISSSFVKKEVIKEDFCTDMISSEDVLFISKILLERGTLGVVRLASYNYRKRFNLTAISDMMEFKKDYYMERLNKFHLYLIDYCKSKYGEIPLFIQNIIICDLKFIIEKDSLFMCDTENEKVEFFDLLKEISNSFDDEIILKSKNLNKSLKFFLYHLRGDNSYYEFRCDDVFLKVNDYTFEKLSELNVLLNKVEVKDNNLILEGFSDSLFDNNFISIEALRRSYDDEIQFFPSHYDTFSKNKNINYLSKTVDFKNNFRIEMPIDYVEDVSLLVNFHKNGDKTNYNPENIISRNLGIDFKNCEVLSDERNNLQFEDNELHIFKDYKFSIVMAIYNTEDYLNEAIDSVINQTIGFEENVQLILVNDGSQDSCEEIILDYHEQYPKNIVVLSQENAGQSTARNNGLEYVRGKYVNFLDSDDYLKENALEEVYKFFEKHYNKTDLVSIPLVQFGRNTNDHILNYKYKKTNLIDLNKEPNNPQLHISSSFVKSSAIEDIRFPTNIVASEDANFANKILLKKHTLGVISNTSYFYRKRDDLSSTIDLASKTKDHYLDRLKNHFMDMINYCIKFEGKVPKFIQYALAYDLAWLIDDYDPEILDNNLERKEFIYYLNQVISYLDDDVISKNRNIKNNLLKSFFVYLKRNDFRIEINEENALIKTGNLTFDQLKTHYIWIDIVEIIDDNFFISGFFNSQFDFNNISVEAVKEKEDGEIEVYKGKYVKYTSRKDRIFLGKIWQFKNNFDIKIPLENNEKSKIRIRVVYQDANNPEDKVEQYLSVHFQRHARLSTISDYIVKDSHLIVFRENVFNVLPYSYKTMVHWERGVRHNLKMEKPIEYNKALNLRLLYTILYPFVKLRNKRIFLYMDRIDVADDNATHLFKYANSQKDDIKNYMILTKKCDDYKKMSKFGKIVDFRSIKHKLLYLFAEKIISTHPYESIINPFFDYDKKLDERPNYNSLATSKIYFLQHGVTKDNISSWMSKFDHNLSLIVTVSEEERKSFFEEGYGYDEDIIQVLGFPRHDNLKDNSSKKEILIIPTWRKNLRGNKTAFLNSDYFKSLNSLLNNEELIDKCEKMGYAIVFKPHPELDLFINDTDERYRDLLDINEKIELSTKRTYQELFNDASILITDYSSVFFDFAYLKKPLIYYQPNDDYHYGESYFDYETMGFGDVITEEEDLIKKIENYMSDGCIMEEKYKKNVEKFFKYTDRNNCKRVYDWIKSN